MCKKTDQHERHLSSLNYSNEIVRKRTEEYRKTNDLFIERRCIEDILIELVEQKYHLTKLLEMTNRDIDSVI